MVGVPSDPVRVDVVLLVVLATVDLRFKAAAAAAALIAAVDFTEIVDAWSSVSSGKEFRVPYKPQVITSLSRMVRLYVRRQTVSKKRNIPS